MADDLDVTRFSHEASIVTEAAPHITPSAQAFTIRAQAANLLSASRIVLAIGWLIAFATGATETLVLGSIAIAGALSDLLDGRIARRMRIANGFGRWLDSFADIMFVLTALSCEAWSGALPWYIPLLIAASFSQYAIDSMLLAGAPIKSRIGHLGGILNFALVIGLALAPRAAWSGITPKLLFPLLAIFYLAGIVERVLGYFQHAN